MSPEPVHTPLGRRLRDRTQPLAPDDQRYGWAHATLSEALERPYQQFQEAFDPEDADPFETLLDPARCPAWALPWLAQLAGVTIPQTASEPQAREMIVSLAGQKRGTTAMLEAAAGMYLTGNKHVAFRERDQSAPDPPYTLEVVTLAGETPDPAATLAALMAQKPAGIVLTYRTVQGQDWQALKESGRTWRQTRTAYANWRNVRDNA